MQASERTICTARGRGSGDRSYGKRRYITSITHSEWASPIVIVPKPDGRIRICGDYKRTVNPVITNDIYPQPTPDELFSNMQGGKKFSKIDLTKAYLQVELHKESKRYLVINTSRGLKEYTRMPYGVKPASGIFQRYIENALKGIPRTSVKIDDILVTGQNDEDHLRNLASVFNVLEEIGATVNKRKCKFFANEIEYVGFIIDKHGLRTNPEKVKAIRVASTHLLKTSAKFPWRDKQLFQIYTQYGRNC